MSELMYDKIIVCSNCGQETPNYEDCVLCGHSLADPDTAPREIAQDDMQEMMIDAKIQEIKAKRALLYDDSWDHAPWLERLQTLAQIAPDNPKVHYYIGAAHFENGDCRQAIVSFTRAIVHKADMVDAIRRRGDCQIALVPVLSGDVQAYYDRCLVDYEAALFIEPDAYTYNMHAAVISSLGQMDEALEEYSQAIALNPDYAESYFNRGYIYKLMGETDKAIADFEAFVSFDRHWNEEMVSMAQGHIKEMTEPD